jgi:hypothetical protein
MTSTKFRAHRMQPARAAACVLALASVWGAAQADTPAFGTLQSVTIAVDDVLIVAQAGTPAPDGRALPLPMPPMPPMPQSPLMSRLAPLNDDVLAFAAAEMSGAKVVKSAPYCADAINEFTQTLADGTRINRKTTSRLCRDSEGRTRQEMTRNTPQGPVTRVYIHDPVAKQMWALNPEKKTAIRVPVLDMTMRLSVVGQPNPEDMKGWQEYTKRMREWMRDTAQRMRQGEASQGPQSGSGAQEPKLEPVIIGEVQKGAGTPGAPGQVERRVEVLRMGGDWMPQGGAPGFSLPLTGGNVGRPAGPGTVTSLGSKEIEGVRADGTRTAWTIEAGKIGNDKPIVIYREEWKSPELLVTVLSRFVDPRNGEQSYKLNGINRTNTSAELFKPPADYAVRETLRRMAPLPAVPPSLPAPSAPPSKG